MSLLIVFGGLPGAGKTTLARSLATHLKATFIRIDSIEQTLQRLDGMKAGHEGYSVAYTLAEDNLRVGNIVVADSVNSIPVTRNAWRDVAARSKAEIVEIEVVCSDKQEHRRRVEDRKADIPGHKLPTWQEVVDREYVPWETSFVVDTARNAIDEAVRSLLRRLTPILQRLDAEQEDLRR